MSEKILITAQDLEKNPFLALALLCQEAANGDKTALLCLGILENQQLLLARNLGLQIELAQQQLALTGIAQGQDVILGH